jgi:hypothetical protein
MHARPQAAYGVGIEVSLREVRVGGYPVRYEVAGEGGEPVVLVHGRSGSTSQGSCAKSESPPQVAAEPWQVPPVPTLLPVVFARQLLKQPVGGALDIVVVFGTGALFGGNQGAAM